ncbi:MAG: hypothetical protein JRE57_00020 [Deltaproteobacteria bacterium]|nr:hypothetical protein [Deltaproteobacteria bacterium]
MSTTPIIQSTGSTSGAGTAGQGRNDLVAGETLTLSDAEATNVGAAYLWTLDDRPIGSTAVLSSATSATPTYVADLEGSYRAKCIVDTLHSATEVHAVPLAVTGSRIPSFAEQTQYDAAGNLKGWHEALDDFMRQVDSLLGSGGPHAASHQDGGGDEISVTGLSGLLADVQTPATHAAAHLSAGADTLTLTDAEIAAANKDGVAGTASMRTLGTGAQQATAGTDARLSDARTPTSHAASHQDGGGDEVSVAGLSGLLADGQTPTTHAASHQNGGGDEISVAGLSGVLADDQSADTIKTTAGPTALAVGAVADGEYLKRSGSTVVGDTPAGGGGTADALATTGADVDVAAAAPPTTGQVLKATAATTATWQDESGGGGSAPIASAQGDFIHATMGTGHSPSINTPLDIDTVIDVRGAFAVSAAGRFSGLKAGRTYRLMGWGRISTNTAGKTQWRDITGAALIGQQAIHYAVNNAGGVSAQPCAVAVIQPLVDTEVELWATDGGMTFSNISTHALIEEIGAVQADVIGGLEFLDSIEVSGAVTSVSFGTGGDGIFGRALDGDSDHEYVLSYYLPDAAVGVADVVVRPNGLSTNQESARHFGGTTEGASTGASWLLGVINTGTIHAGSVEIQAETGRQRIFHGTELLRNSTQRWSIQNSATWTDTAANIESLDIVSTVASGIAVGAQFHLWRRTRNNLRADSASTYERNVEATVEQGTNAEVEYTTGHASRGGSAIAVSASLNGDTVTAGSITVVLKVAGATVLTATLDTTNAAFHRELENVGVHPVASGDEVSIGISTSGLTTTGGGTPGVTVNAMLVADGIVSQPTNIVAETVLASDSATLTLDGLDGDLHGTYEVEWHLLLPDGSTHNVDMQPNGSASNLVGRFSANFASPAAVTAWDIIVGLSSQTDRELVGKARIQANRTRDGVAVKRIYRLDGALTFTADPYAAFYSEIGYWTSASDNLTSLDIVNSVVNGLLAGSWAIVRKV